MSRIPEWAERGRAAWRYRGQERPPFAETPGPSQESVWDYPRPPDVVPERRRVVVRLGDTLLADTRGALRVRETASPPTFYLPPVDIERARLEPGRGASLCEWKGESRYWDVVIGDIRVERAGWSYPQPLPGFEAIRDYLSFYPARVECYVDGERVRPQPGGFYGGWWTDDIAGSVKGEPGTQGW